MRRAAALILAAALAGPVAFGGAAAKAFGATPHAQARLLAGWETTEGARMFALAVDLAPGWKTYWRAPGESGIPPTFDWTGSENVASVAVEWPAPHLFDSFGLATLGYTDRVVLPIRVEAADPDAPIRLRLALDYGVCSDICVPARADLALDLPPGAAAEGRAEIEAALASRPLGPEAAGVVAARCDLAGAGQRRAFSAEIAFDPPPPAAPYVVVEGPEGLWVGPAAVTLDGGALTAEAEAQVWGETGWIGRDSLDLTLIAGTWAAEIPGCAAPKG